MKQIKYMLLGLLVMGVYSCTDSGAPGTSPQEAPTLDKKQQKEQMERFKRVSKFAVYNHTMDKVIILDPMDQEKNGITFAEPGTFNFANSNGSTLEFGVSGNMQFVETDDGTGIVFLSDNGGFGDGAGGIVTAGPSTLPIDYAFCFSAGSEFFFGNLDTGSGDIGFDGVSGVFGFSGDLQALSMGEFDEDDDIFDYFRGYAYYWVYADEASGTFDILDWYYFDEDFNSLQDEGFALVYDFEQGNIFWSIDGTLQVGAADMTFNGSYFAWLDFLSLFFDGEDFDGEFAEVDGYGSMGCN